AFLEHRLDRGQYNRQIFRLAPRHHGVDRDLLDRRRSEPRWHEAEHFLRVARRAVEHAQNALLGRRYQRQPIRPAAPEHRLLLVLILADFDPSRSEPGLVEADFEALNDTRLDILGAAAGARFRQLAAEPRNAGQALPFAAVPAIGAVDFAPFGEP